MLVIFDKLVNRLKGQNTIIMLIGISFGTKSIVCYYCNTTTEGNAIGCLSGPVTVPAAISFDSTEEVFGQTALDSQGIHPHVLVNMKRLLGKRLDSIKRLASVNVSCCRLVDTPDGIVMRTPSLNRDGKTTDIKITACTTQLLKNVVQYAVGTEVSLPSIHAVVTYPLGADQSLIKEIGKSISEMQLGDHQLISKSAAIALAYYRRYPEIMENQTYMVYSLGGGMFETSIVRFSEKKLNICSYDGDSALGGIDMDNAILDYVIRMIVRDIPSFSMDMETRFKLNTRCEKAKEELSHSETAAIDVSNYVPGKAIMLSRDKFNQLIKTIVEKTITITTNLTLTWKGIHPSMQPVGILLAGGSTNIPYVQQQLREALHLSTTSVIPVCDVAALGCCEYGIVAMWR